MDRLMIDLYYVYKGNATLNIHIDTKMISDK